MSRGFNQEFSKQYPRHPFGLDFFRILFPYVNEAAFKGLAQIKGGADMFRNDESDISRPTSAPREWLAG